MKKLQTKIAAIALSILTLGMFSSTTVVKADVVNVTIKLVLMKGKNWFGGREDYPVAFIAQGVFQGKVVYAKNK